MNLVRDGIVFSTLLLLSLLLCSCKKKSTLATTALTLPEISTFATTPSDQFILSATGLAKVSRAFPYKGTLSTCAHQGAHLNFTNSGAPYAVDLIAPAAGTISRIDPCYVLSGSDKYEVSMKFATSGDEAVSMDFSLEPQHGYLCSGGVSGSDNGFYSTYIRVTEGQTVAKGDVIAQMYKSNSGDDGAHIHFNLRVSGRSAFACPNIFSSTITSQFGALYGGETCSGTSMPSTLCYLPDSTEDLTGL